MWCGGDGGRGNTVGKLGEGSSNVTARARTVLECGRDGVFRQEQDGTVGGVDYLLLSLQREECMVGGLGSMRQHEKKGRERQGWGGRLAEGGAAMEFVNSSLLAFLSFWDMDGSRRSVG